MLHKLNYLYCQIFFSKIGVCSTNKQHITISKPLHDFVASGSNSRCAGKKIIDPTCRRKVFLKLQPGG